MNNEKTTHDLLIEELRKYYIENVKWERKNTHTAAIEVRKHLSEIRRLASIRRNEVQANRKPTKSQSKE